MRTLLIVVAAIAMSKAIPAQAPELPLGDTRLTVHTLLREDIFAGFLQNDLARLGRAERNADALLASRPAERAPLLAWQGSIALTRAAQAYEAGRLDEFRQQHQRAQALFADAIKLGPDTVGVFAIVGGTEASIADRLPAAERQAGWELAYAAYQQLWKLQGQILEKLPVHHKGEVLSGMAQSADRTGRSEEAAAQVERILKLLPDTAYAARAREWQGNPSRRATATLTCQTCHAPGTLVARIADVSKK
jgi:tetratricopeptide (TPR) repeat protein